MFFFLNKSLLIIFFDFVNNFIFLCEEKAVILQSAKMRTYINRIYLKNRIYWQPATENWLYNMIPFVHLHVHSQYSILDGMAPVGALVDKAVADGMRGMAITDHGNMYGIKEFHDYVSKLNSKRAEKGEELFKPIFGCEVYVAWKDRHDRSDKRDNGNHLILLAKNLQGY